MLFFLSFCTGGLRFKFCRFDEAAQLEDTSAVVLMAPKVDRPRKRENQGPIDPDQKKCGIFPWLRALRERFLFLSPSLSANMWSSSFWCVLLSRAGGGEGEEGWGQSEDSPGQKKRGGGEREGQIQIDWGLEKKGKREKKEITDVTQRKTARKNNMKSKFFFSDHFNVIFCRLSLFLWRIPTPAGVLIKHTLWLVAATTPKREGEIHGCQLGIFSAKKRKFGTFWDLLAFFWREKSAKLFLAFFGIFWCPLKIYINKCNNNEKPIIFSPSSINVVTKNNVWVQNVALNVVLEQENHIKHCINKVSWSFHATFLKKALFGIKFGKYLLIKLQ